MTEAPDKPKNDHLKSWLKFLLKVALSAIALYIVSRKIDVQETIGVIRSVNVPDFLIAMFLFVISHIISAFRLNVFYSQIEVNISTFRIIKLYSKGMFYNLFLPGGIGGDAYKVYILKQNNEVTTKKLIAATIIDRISGLIALFCLTIILLLMSTATKYIREDYWYYIALSLIPIAYACYYLVLRFFFSYFIGVFSITNLYSLGKQVFYLLPAFFVLKSLDVGAYYWDYLSLFMVSSVVAVAPISIGGVGLRELAFVYAYEYFMIDKNTAVAFTLLFFSITVVTSLIGAFINVDLNDDEEKENG